MLHDGIAEVRRAAVETLGWLGDVRAVEPLLAISCDSDEDVRITAVEVLTRFGASIVEPLASILGGSDEDLREAAIGVLVRLGFSLLVAALRNSDKEVRLASVEALGRLVTRGP